MIPMIVRVWCESGAGWAPTPVPVTPQTTCRDVLECCRDPGDEPCLLLCVHPHHGVHVLRDSELPLEVASALGPDVQFVLKYIDVDEQYDSNYEYEDGDAQAYDMYVNSLSDEIEPGCPSEGVGAHAHPLGVWLGLPCSSPLLSRTPSPQEIIHEPSIREPQTNQIKSVVVEIPLGSISAEAEGISVPQEILKVLGEVKSSEKKFGPKIPTEISERWGEILIEDKRLEKMPGIARLVNLTSDLINKELSKIEIINKLSEVSQILLDLYYEYTTNRRRLIISLLDESFINITQGVKRETPVRLPGQQTRWVQRAPRLCARYYSTTPHQPPLLQGARRPPAGPRRSPCPPAHPQER